jgi:hypothetical protein
LPSVNRPFCAISGGSLVVAPHEHGLASGLVQSSGQVGTAFILAVVTALIGVIGHNFAEFHRGLNLVAGVALAGLLVNLVPLVARRRVPQPALQR